VCDPIDDHRPYLQAAEQLGLKIIYVLDTHVHADHISGARKLAEVAGARYALYAQAGAQYDFAAVREGDVLELGNVQIRVLHTPGHTVPRHNQKRTSDSAGGKNLRGQRAS